MSKKIRHPLFSIWVLTLLISCSTKPQPINYGSDACAFCQMTIVDKQHAAQIVTVKGKAYKYDAIECMLNNYRKWNNPEAAHFLVNDYSNPGALVNAEEAWYLISEEIPSPMGEFLTAFESKNGLKSLGVTGDEYSWTELKSKFELDHKKNTYEK